jgi:hypothetical protein
MLRLQRACSCAGASGHAGAVCAPCKQQKKQLDRGESVAVDRALRSTGRPLDLATRAAMEPRFGHDFSQVRVHAGTAASESARALGASAYTVGRDIVFDVSRYAPGTSEGQKLLAHELAHVTQQAGAVHATPAAQLSVDPDVASEREAARSAEAMPAAGTATAIATGRAAPPAGFVAVQRQPNPLDDRAKAIVAKAKDASVDSNARAIQLVKDIVAAYYPSDAAKVDGVIFNDAKAGTGLNTESVGSGASAKGTISAGTYFLEHVDSFARRVLQVGHELEHIDQYRGGLAGGTNKNKREFLAFHDEALAAEKPGTGRLPYATRRSVIDAALGYYYCLADAERTSFESKKNELLSRRVEVNGKGGNEPTDPPTSCKTQSP